MRDTNKGNDSFYEGHEPCPVSVLRFRERNEIMLFETKRCIVCDESSTLIIDDDRYGRWQKGEHVQDVWSDWRASHREMLITGTHPKCWNGMMEEE